jgi:hypothetical protein
MQQYRMRPEPDSAVAGGVIDNVYAAPVSHTSGSVFVKRKKACASTPAGTAPEQVCRERLPCDGCRVDGDVSSRPVEFVRMLIIDVDRR